MQWSYFLHTVFSVDQQISIIISLQAIATHLNNSSPSQPRRSTIGPLSEPYHQTFPITNKEHRHLSDPQHHKFDISGNHAHQKFNLTMVDVVGELRSVTASGLRILESSGDLSGRRWLGSSIMAKHNFSRRHSTGTRRPGHGEHSGTETGTRRPRFGPLAHGGADLVPRQSRPCVIGIKSVEDK
jgi:hypothetical protein